MKVRRMISSRSGKPVANQFILIDIEKDIMLFQSYETVIAKKEGGELFLDANHWNYSVTTSKYRNQFTGLSTKETEAGIKSGEIYLVNLN